MDISTALTEEELQELAEAFDLFDKDGDQSIAAKELHVVLQAIGRNVTERDVHRQILKIKADQRIADGESEIGSDEEDDYAELDKAEFIDYISKEMRDNDMEELVEAFRTFGPQNERYGINREQLRKTMEEYGEKIQDNNEFEQLFEDLDRDKNGEIGFEDFIKVMMSKN